MMNAWVINLIIGLFILIPVSLLAQESGTSTLSIEEPLPDVGYVFPPSAIAIPTGFGMDPGEWGLGVAAWDCHWGIDNCQNDGSAMISYGIGDQAKGIGLTLQLSILSIRATDGGFADKGAFGFKLSHFFVDSQTAIAFGVDQLTGWETNSDFGYYNTSYIALSHFSRFGKTDDGSKQFPFSFTVGFGNRVLGETDWVSFESLPYHNWLPFFGVGYSVNDWLSFVADEYSDGVTDIGVSVKPIRAVPLQLFLGVLDLFVVENEQERQSIVMALTYSK